MLCPVPTLTPQPVAMGPHRSSAPGTVGPGPEGLGPAAATTGPAQGAAQGPAQGASRECGPGSWQVAGPGGVWLLTHPNLPVFGCLKPHH